MVLRPAGALIDSPRCWVIVPPLPHLDDGPEFVWKVGNNMGIGLRQGKTEPGIFSFRNYFPLPAEIFL